jgi:hypothetical protein
MNITIPARNLSPALIRLADFATHILAYRKNSEYRLEIRGGKDWRSIHRVIKEVVTNDERAPNLKADLNVEQSSMF